MIELKNRTRETLTYQYAAAMSAGPVRPQVVEVHRGEHNPKTGQITRKRIDVALGGVLTLDPKSSRKGLPDALADHPGLKRDIAARRVTLIQHKNPTPTKASAAPIERKAPSDGRSSTRKPTQ